MTSPLPTDEDREALAQEISAFRHNSEVAWDEDRELADHLLAGCRRSVVSTPSEAEALVDAIQRAIDTESFRMKYDEDPGEPAGAYIAVDAITRAIDSVPIPAAVSAPPTITDEMVERAADAIAKARGYVRGASLDEHYRDARAALRAALGGEA